MIDLEQIESDLKKVFFFAFFSGLLTGVGGLALLALAVTEPTSPSATYEKCDASTPSTSSRPAAWSERAVAAFR